MITFISIVCIWVGLGMAALALANLSDIKLGNVTERHLFFNDPDDFIVVVAGPISIVILLVMLGWHYLTDGLGLNKDYWWNPKVGK